MSNLKKTYQFEHEEIKSCIDCPMLDESDFGCECKINCKLEFDEDHKLVYKISNDCRLVEYKYTCVDHNFKIHEFNTKEEQMLFMNQVVSDIKIRALGPIWTR